jgi:hypothetical protein
MEGVVVEVRLRAPVNNSQLRTTAFEIALHVVLTVTKAKLHSFFPLRTIRVVTRVLDRRPMRSSSVKKCRTPLRSAIIFNVRALSSTA